MAARREALVLDLAVAAMCAVALVRGVLATRGLAWPCDVDLYRDIGFAQSMRDGFLFADPLYRGEWLWYPPLVPGLVALSSLVSGLPVHHAATLLGPYLNLLAPVAFYVLCGRLFGRRVGVAALLSFLFIGLGGFPSWAAATYSPWLFPGTFVQGIFYLGLAALHRALQPAATWRAGLLRWLGVGLLLGLCALGHSAPAMILGGVAALCFAYRFLRPPDGQSRVESVGGFALMLAAAFVVALPYTSSVLFHYGLDVQNQAPSSWTYHRLDLHRLPLLWRDLLTPALLLPLIGYFAVLLASPRVAKPWARAVTLGWLIVSAALLAYAYLNQWLRQHGISAPMAVPAHHFHLYLKAAEALFIGHALVQAGRLLAWFAGRLARRISGATAAGPDRPRELVALALALAFALVLALPVHAGRDDFTSERQKAGMLTPDPDMANVHRWILANTPADAVFLADDHLSLHLVSPAGRKVVAMIPFFSNPFVPWKDRHEDRAHIFTALGLGDERRFQPLAKKYTLDYLVERGSLAVKIYGSSAPFLDVAYRSGGYWVFKVKRRTYQPDNLPPH